jgi:hypothetical protein
VAAILIHNFVDFITFAISNSNVDAIALLYTQARNELLVLLEQGGNAEARQDLRYSADVLASFSDIEHYKARFMGFMITFDILRTLLAPLFTLGVGLWSIMRNLWIFATVETYCPTR